MAEKPPDVTRRMIVENLFESFPDWMKKISRYYWNQVTETEWVTMGQYQILFLISEDKKTIGALAEKKKVSQPTISRQVETLVNKGFIIRKRDGQDRRVVILELTELGNELLYRVKEQTLDWLSEELSALSEEDLDLVRKTTLLLNSVFIDSEKS